VAGRPRFLLCLTAFNDGHVLCLTRLQAKVNGDARMETELTGPDRDALIKRLLDNLAAVSMDNQMLIAAPDDVHIFVEQKGSLEVPCLRLPFKQVIAMIRRLQKGRRNPGAMVLIIPSDAKPRPTAELLAQLGRAAGRAGFNLAIIPVQIPAEAVMAAWRDYMAYLPLLGDIGAAPLGCGGSGGSGAMQ
jgi:hypothetical protein